MSVPYYIYETFLNEFNLIDYIKFNDILKIKEFINNKKDLNIKDEYSLTPVMWSVILNQMEILIELLNAEVDLKPKSSEGWSALDWAKYYDRKEMIKLLEHKTNFIKKKKSKKND